jgi:acetyl-CoA acetyltransferase
VRDVAVIGFAEAPNVRHTSGTTNGVEMLVPIFREVFDQTGLSKEDIGFWCSGSSDYLAGRAFSFVSAVDAIGAFPPVMESHVGMAEVAARSRAAAVSNARAQLAGDVSVDDLLAAPYVAEPLRAHDCAPVTDGASVVIIAAGDRARELCARPAWISGFEHRIDSGSFGARDLTSAPSASAAGAAAGAADVEVAELHAPFTHQEIVLTAALGLADSVRVSPSGGALAGNPMFAAGLARIGHAARQISTGAADRALGHATSGPALQQNLVCVMEAR